MGFIILCSLILMQISRNLSDAWLAHWIESTTNSNALATQQDTLTDSYSETITRHLQCIFDKLFTFHNIEECMIDKSTILTQEQLRASQNSYYLAIYIGIAAFNSVIALLRAFAFAYAGLRAAKFLHNRLLNSVIFVRFATFLLRAKVSYHEIILNVNDFVLDRI